MIEVKLLNFKKSTTNNKLLRYYFCGKKQISFSFKNFLVRFVFFNSIILALIFCNLIISIKDFKIILQKMIKTIIKLKINGQLIKKSNCGILKIILYFFLNRNFNPKFSNTKKKNLESCVNLNF